MIKMSSRVIGKARGALIVLEGCDRSGKTTQCQKLVDALRKDGQKVEFLRFPDRSTAIGTVINDYLEKRCELEDHAVHLLFAANRWELVPRMKTLMESGTTLIVDRYSYSGVAFTAAKKGFSIDWCKQPEKGLPKPDLVLYLTLSAEEAAKRAEFGGERYEQTDFQKKVAENYKKLHECDWKTVDASQSIEDIHREIKHLVTDSMTSTQQQDLQEMGKLWMEEENS
ncbi:thymidylate kinase-like [Ptychodera flava]|uniref:thymidylate kinase-like n=1 Tax=Ptychodera flava TaxID=63121 RepID=UPI003969CECB